MTLCACRQWLPMDTVPRDGTEVLLVVPYGLSKRVMIGWAERDGTYWGYDGEWLEDPKGWQPIPRFDGV